MMIYCMFQVHSQSAGGDGDALRQAEAGQAQAAVQLISERTCQCKSQPLQSKANF